MRQDFIRITNLKIFAHHGVFEEEKQNGQDFFIHAKLYLDCKAAANTDNLEESVNYGEVCHFMTDVFSGKKLLENLYDGQTVKYPYDLIEAAAQHLCECVLLKFDKLQKIELELQKPHAPIGLPFENVSINMTRGWHTVYVSFGSNMGDKQALIEEGIQKLRADRRIRNVIVSGLITTKPYGPVEQEDFLNGCLKLETLMDAEELLAYLHRIEAEAERKRIVRWGPRTLDMDIVFYDREVYESDDLIIPHVDMQNRAFVLQPLMELCPNLRHPILGKTVSQMYADLTESLGGKL
uniref:2-amino-4-hydroxy-6- hydroxymethyldihydropteridine diphosphokinase n=1 Tax=Agathobacter sp. TaxID=2021311 RepID=UPI0040567789